MRRSVAAGRAAFGTAVVEDIAAFGVGLRTVGEHQTAAGVRAVARENVHMEGCEAERTMVARGVAERLDLPSA